MLVGYCGRCRLGTRCKGLCSGAAWVDKGRRDKPINEEGVESDEVQPRQALKKATPTEVFQRLLQESELSNNVLTCSPAAKYECTCYPTIFITGTTSVETRFLGGTTLVLSEASKNGSKL